MKRLMIALVVLGLGITALAHADENGVGSNFFKNQISAYQSACKGECKHPFSRFIAFDINDPRPSAFNPKILHQLSMIANQQAQIWADTILEGDYYADGKTRVDKVLALYKNNEFIGYNITYSERAWYIGECRFSGANIESLRLCQEGRIHESTFVSPDLATYFRDNADYAGFEN